MTRHLLALALPTLLLASCAAAEAPPQPQPTIEADGALSIPDGYQPGAPIDPARVDCEQYLQMNPPDVRNEAQRLCASSAPGERDRNPYCQIEAITAACTRPAPDAGPALSPAQAVPQAQAAGPKGVTATFEMPVASVELYSTAPRLHSEADHENGKALSVHLSEAAHQTLAARLGADYTKTLQGKRIRVTGTAQRFHVASFTAGEDSKAFERTVIELQDAADLVVL